MKQNVIQIAGVSSIEEYQLIANFDIDYIGFPLRLPVNKEDLSDRQAAEMIVSHQPPPHPVLITYLKKADEVLALSNFIGTNCVQLHGDILVEELQNLKLRAPNLTIFKSLVVKKNNLDELRDCLKLFEPYVDAFLTDTFDPVTGACGGTGKTHDWSISRYLVQISKKPVILAGGLNPQNVTEAILHVKPAGVDVHTGVEDILGRKDQSLLHKFVSNARWAFNRLVHS